MSTNSVATARAGGANGSCGTGWLQNTAALEGLDPAEVVAMAVELYSPAIGIAFSGAEDVVLIDMATRVHLPFRVFCLDTGRLHAETYEFIERVRSHYDISIQTFFPDAAAVEKLVREKGLFSFYRDGHRECCEIRKVEPLRRALVGLEAWITGQRRDQNPSTRSRIPVAQVDRDFSVSDRPLMKFNPLAGWDSIQVWEYIQQNAVPYNALHNQGYISVGCQPCTRPVHPGQHERDGRWWWEQGPEKECGLHAGNGRSLAESNSAGPELGCLLPERQLNSREALPVER